MNKEGRIINSSRNLIYGLISQVITLILGFLVRTFFIIHLNIVYLGVNGLFSNILTVLSLVELGFGTAMIHSMYKPLANKDVTKLQALMNLYAKVYTIVGLAVAVLGLSIIPFMGFIIKDMPDIQNLTIIYILFLMNSVASYFYANKKSVLFADQKAFINSKYHYIFSTVKSFMQIAVLIIFENFILFLIIQVLATFFENYFVSRKVNIMYPFLKEKNSEVLEKNELTRIKNDVKALILSKIGSVALTGTNNIVISIMIGIQAVGLLSNYTLVTGSLIMIISQLTTAITGSVGNFVAIEKTEKSYELFKKIDLVHYWIYGFSTVGLVILINPLITLWIGKNYTLSLATVIIIGANFMIDGLLNSFWTFRTTMGLFVQGKYRPIIAAIISIAASLILVQFFGLIGVLLGTTCSKVLVNVWYDPYIIFKHGFNKSPKPYYKFYIIRILILVVIIAVLQIISKQIIDIENVTIGGFVALGVVTVLLPNIVLLAIYYKTAEFKDIFIMLKRNFIKL